MSVGDNFEHAKKMAKEVLELHVYCMEKDGDDVPIPTTEPRQLEIYPETNEGYIISDVNIYPDSLKEHLGISQERYS